MKINCCFCDVLVEYGRNPFPLYPEDDVVEYCCCEDCDFLIVLPCREIVWRHKGSIKIVKDILPMIIHEIKTHQRKGKKITHQSLRKNKMDLESLYKNLSQIE